MDVRCERDQLFRFDPTSTALISIDYQRDFISPEGMCAARGMATGELASAVSQASRLLEWGRSIGLTIVHTQEEYREDLSDLNPYRTFRDGIIGAEGPLGRFLIRGEGGTQIYPAVAPREGELIISKAAFNAFHCTELDQYLTGQGISHLILMGVTTQCCVGSTLRSAVDHGYFPLLVEDSCAAFERTDHENSISVIYSENHLFGWVTDSERLLSSS